MNTGDELKRGGLAGKMEGFTPPPPESVWTGIAGQVGGGGRRSVILIMLAAAAGVALALTVGLSLFHTGNYSGDKDIIASEQQGIQQLSPVNIYGNKNVEEDKNERNKNSSNQTTSVETSKRKESKLKKITSDKPSEDAENVRVRKEDLVREAVREAIAAQEGVQMAQDIEENAIDNPVTSVGEITEGEIAEDSNPTGDIEAQTSAKQEKINEDSLLNLLHANDYVIEEETDVEKAGKKWQIGGGLSPQLSYRDVTSATDYQQMIVNSSETAKLTYAGGLNVSYRPSRRLSVEAGIYYNKMGLNIGDFNTFASNLFGWDEIASEEKSGGNLVSISNSIGTIVTESNDRFVNNYSTVNTVADYHLLSPEELTLNDEEVTGFSQVFEYLEIPFNLKYKILDRDFDIQLIGGMSTNLLMNNSVSARTADGVAKIGEVDNVRSVNYSGNAGIGFIYNLTRNLNISIEPRFRYYVNSINLSYLPSTRPYTFGVLTGVNYIF